MTIRQRERALEISVAVLGAIAAAGVIASIAIMPGVAMAFAPFARRKPSRQRYAVDRALKRLIRRGFVERVPGRIERYRLTDRGKQHLTHRELGWVKIARPKRWDAKWRLIIFDVPEKRRHLRDSLRGHLERLGLAQIQKSAWLYPFSCDDLVRMLQVDLGLHRNVQYFTIAKFADTQEEKHWRYHFDV